MIRPLVMVKLKVYRQMNNSSIKIKVQFQKDKSRVKHGHLLLLKNYWKTLHSFMDITHKT
jgi:hypothetical protein